MTWEAREIASAADRERALRLLDGGMGTGTLLGLYEGPALVGAAWVEPAEPDSVTLLACRGADGLAAVATAVAPARLDAAVWAGADPDLERLLADAGYTVHFEKLYVRRSLEALPEAGAVRLEPASAGELRSAFRDALDGYPWPDLLAGDPDRELDGMRLREGSAHDPAAWCVARVGEDVVGVVLAHRFPGSDREGTFTFVGVAREHRGRGIGRSVHAAGLRLLAELGATSYLCATHVQNAPMIALYRAVGCTPVGIRRELRRR